MNKQTGGTTMLGHLFSRRKIVALAAALLVLADSGVVQAGNLYGWGHNSFGQLGDGTSTDHYVPMPVDMSGVLSGKIVTAIAAGGVHTVALTSDGKVYDWGYNGSGQLGDGTTTNRSRPVAVDMSRVLLGKIVTSISGGLFHTVALASDGRVYAWGDNTYGQLGDGTTTSSTTPVAVQMIGALSRQTVIAIAGAESHTVALTSEGKVYGWGRNNEGELGDGTTISRTTPVAVDMSGALSGKVVTAITVGDEHTVALTSDGRVYAWGRNTYGQLGDGTFTNRTTPVAVNTSGVLSGKIVTAIAAGGDHTVALTSDGQVFDWGNNSYGQLGNGTIAHNSMPVAAFSGGVLAGKIVTAIAAGGVHTLARISDGRVYAWGNNSYGELGDGTITSRTTPVAVNMNSVLSGQVVTALAAGYYHTIGLVAPVPYIGFNQR